MPYIFYHKQAEEQIFCKSKWPVTRTFADHNNQIERWGEDDNASGLQAELFLATGCRVMLHTNQWTEEQLVNSALGIAKDIVYIHREELMSLLLVEFVV